MVKLKTSNGASLGFKTRMICILINYSVILIEEVMSESTRLLGRQVVLCQLFLLKESYQAVTGLVPGLYIPHPGTVITLS